MKTSVFKMLSAAAIIILASGMSAAQTKEERIKFAAGKSSAIVSNNLSANQVRTYVLYLKAGQQITVKVRSPSGKVDVDGANISAGQFEEAGNKSFNVPVDRTGDYQVYVRNTGKAAARFKLVVTVR